MSEERGPPILVVDDLADAADSMALLLRLWGHDAEACYDGPSALEAARACRPRVVLMDVGMPRMHGFEVATRLRERPELVGILIIGVSGYADLAHRRRALAAGFDHYLVKPVELDDLRALLARVTATRHAFVMPEREGQPRPSGTGALAGAGDRYRTRQDGGDSLSPGPFVGRPVANLI
jgi:CheY-like chemotaxis protein